MKKGIIFSYIGRFLKTALGLAIFGMGIYFTIQGNTGTSPWDTLALGVSGKITGMTYGTANITISLIVLALDFLMKEPIGFGSIMNAILIGMFTDLYTSLNLLPKQDNIFVGLLFLIGGLFLMAIGQYFYMSGRMGCGPRDALLVGLGKRVSRWPIGVVQTIILVVVLAAGFFLGAKVGIGTVVATFGIGTAMQIVFRFLHFEPRKLVHEDVVQTIRCMMGRFL